jgi:DAACS family dicarboxylate/amino acid:cation (Na+ or H+) symporter
MRAAIDAGTVGSRTPYAVAALLFSLTARFGTDILGRLGVYAFCVVLAIAIHMFVVLPLWVRYVGGMNVLYFFRGSEAAIITAFSTASSTGTLPTTLKVAEENLKLPPQIARFVLTIGASANHHGTALFEGLTTLFLAQCFGVDLGIGQQIIVLGLHRRLIGTAGAAGSLPVIAVILGYLHCRRKGSASSSASTASSTCAARAERICDLANAVAGLKPEMARRGRRDSVSR